MNKEPRCEICLFARIGGMDDDWECHRHSPIAVSDHEQYKRISAWPVVSDSDWCGDFQIDPEVEAAR